MSHIPNHCVPTEITEDTATGDTIEEAEKSGSGIGINLMETKTIGLTTGLITEPTITGSTGTGGANMGTAPTAITDHHGHHGHEGHGHYGSHHHDNHGGHHGNYGGHGHHSDWWKHGGHHHG